MLAAVAGTVDPPDLARRRRGGQRVEHREDRGRADAGIQQNDGSAARPEHEIAPWRARLEHVTDPDLSVDASPAAPCVSCLTLIR